MKKKEFKSESKRLLDLMINSIYTNKDIFLRELISNASDALDKLYYNSLTDDTIKVDKENLKIKIDTNEENKTITITDNGCGMSKEELEENLGTIAKSGSLAFKEASLKDDISIIGQFGVGFYSAFMVSKKIEVVSKKANSSEAYKWISTGPDGYSIEQTEKDNIGTTITLYLKDNDEECNYDEYLHEHKIISLIKKYSDYISYPIEMEVLSYDKDEKEKKELKTINSMIPIWKKNSKEVKDEEYNNFYMGKFYDYEPPLKVISYGVEGLTSYKALLFIPKKAPYDFYTKEYEKGLELYSNGVLIMDKAKDLLPDYYSFVKGVVDTEDLSLNISREMLQKTKAVSVIAKNIESKIKSTLEDMLKNERDKYIEFFRSFGTQIKYGIYNNYGLDKDKLKDLIMFYSSKTKELITLKQYVDAMQEGQESIYYIAGESLDKIDNLPQVEQVKDKGYEILYLTESVDEFTINALMEYDGKKFVNVSSEELNLDEEEDKNRIKKINDDNKKLLDDMKNMLNVNEVRFTNKLKTHPVCLTTKGHISTEMEKIINSMPTDEKIKAEVVLEINENHPIADKIRTLYKKDKDKFNSYGKVLYAEARLIEGLPVDNPTEISNLVCDLLATK